MSAGLPMEWICRDRTLNVGARPLVMGILNVTPDSFSDGGRYATADAAIARAIEMDSQGADIIDVGGESTRPNAVPVPVEEERKRVVAVVNEISRQCRALISIDTTKAAVARDAVSAGAHIINDISALGADAHMTGLARESGAGVILMHMKGTPRTMQENPVYGDVVSEVRAFLAERVDVCQRAGIRTSSVAVDPGIGFGKTLEHNLALLAQLERLTALDRPVVVGISRKSMLGRITGNTVDARLPASIAGLVFCIMKGANVLRVHDVRESLDAIRVVTALRNASATRIS